MTDQEQIQQLKAELSAVRDQLLEHRIETYRSLIDIHQSLKELTLEELKRAENREAQILREWEQRSRTKGGQDKL